MSRDLNRRSSSISNTIVNTFGGDRAPELIANDQKPADSQIGRIIAQHESNGGDVSPRLQTQLEMCKIVFILDDSSSMRSSLQDSPLNQAGVYATRWDELKQFAKISFEIAKQFNRDGIDMLFLNRPGVQNARNFDEIEPRFVQAPNGYTPLTQAMHTVLSRYRKDSLGGRNLLIIVMTDGEPTDDRGVVDIAGFRQVMDSRDSHVFTTIVSCTDDNRTMSYLNNWDQLIPRLDVVDDFRSERAEVQRAMGSNFQFSYEDYVMKILAGSINSNIDKLDEI